MDDQCYAYILVHSSSKGVLTWLMAGILLKSQVLFCTEIHGPTCASAIILKQASKQAHDDERERERERERAKRGGTHDIARLPELRILE